MNLETFLRLVEQMLDAQREYIRSPTEPRRIQRDIRQANVERAIMELRQGQGNLFGGEA